MFKMTGRIIHWTGQYKKRMYLGFLWSFIQSIFIAMPIMGAALFLDFMIKDSRGKVQITRKYAWFALGFMIVAILGRFLFSYLKAIYQESIAYEKTSEQRIDIGDILKRVSLGFFDENDTGKLIGAVTTDLSFFEMYAMSMTNNVVGAYIHIAAMILCMAFFCPQIALVAFIAEACSTFFLYKLSARSEKNSVPHQDANDDLIRAVLEFVRGLAVVKTYGQEGASTKGIVDAFKNHRKINLKIEQEYTWVNAMHQISCKMGSAAIVLVSAIMTIHGTMELSIFLMMAIFSFVIFSQQELVQNSAHTLQVIKASMDKLEKIEQAKFIDEDGKEKKLDSYDIVFDHVYFGYEEQSVLENINVTIPEGTTTAIVGPSGSGKTTLCRLLARFYDVKKGKITIGGTDISTMKCDKLLENISMVFQNVYLFRDTIRNNICFGKPDATEEEMIEAAKKACCHDFIMSLKDGYDTVIGEGGGTLSGGEKQRVSIARAILKDAPIVILDEATASVDPENEHLIQTAISELTKGKTLITIAHRLATVEHADQILVVEDKTIKEKGTHEELIEKNGTYKKFIDIRRWAEGWKM